MQSANNNTYISKRMMSLYQEERQKKQITNQVNGSQSALPLKSFSAEEEKSQEKQMKAVIQPKAKAQEKKKSSGILSFLGFGGEKKKNDASDNSSSEEVMNEEVYQHRNISAEECDSDDLAGELNLSDCEDNVVSRGEIKRARKNERK